MSLTGGIILLSSSPPRLFAPSPTPVDKPSPSSPLPSPDAIFASQRPKALQNEASPRQIQISWLEEQRRFEKTSTARECLGSGARLSETPLLKERRNRENVPLLNRRLESKIGDKESGTQEDRRSISPARRQRLGQDKDIDGSSTKQNTLSAAQNDHRAQGEANEKRPSQELSPLRVGKAPSRKLDWTPPTTRTREECPDPAAVSFCASLRGSFGYSADLYGPNIAEPIRTVDQGMAIKRMKLNIVDTSSSASLTAMGAPRLLPKTSKSNDEPTRNRAKSPKKYTTITGSATASYFGAVANEASPIMQYLSATQQRALDDHSDSPLSVPNTAKRKPIVKKSKAAKKAPRRSALVSPQSAMKAFEDQDMLFGSASQLARDESPSSTRDTVQAIKHSEPAVVMSDPTSTQISIPTSDAPQTPKRHDRRGVSRFAKFRNLWSAAGRDDDNALLQVDTVDMFDSPDIRTAFAGKDVLLEPGAPRPRESLSPEKLLVGQEGSTWPSSGNKTRPSPTLRDGDVSLAREMKPLLGIDRLAPKTSCSGKMSKVSSQVRSLHSTASGEGDTSQGHIDRKIEQTEPSDRVSNLPPDRPSYQGLTTSQLASQLTAFGFKPVKKREKMIEVLDRCWDAKNKCVSRVDAKAPAVLDKTTEMSHGEFLTKVHDVSARPTPKITKPRGRPKKDGTSSTQKSKAKRTLPKKSSREHIREETNATDGKERQAADSARTRVRKAQGVNTALSATSPDRKTLEAKRKSKKTLPSEEHILDVDDIEDDDDDDLGHNAAEDLIKNTTGVKPANPGRAYSLPSLPPSSDAFEAAAWLSETTVATTSRVSKKATRLASFDSKRNANPNPADDAAPFESSAPSSAISAIAAATKTRTTPRSIATTTTTTDPSSFSPSQPPQLSGQITVAITTFQRPQNSSIHNSRLTPTFHEKILMYDPIVLEDLAAWLNTKGFKAIGEDREVGPIEVREWCEERGICCLWKGGWRGNNDKGSEGTQ